MAHIILPPELISRILGYVHDTCTLEDRRDLVSCSSVSCAWHDLTQPWLFREVSFTYDTGSQDTSLDIADDEGADEAAAQESRGVPVVPGKTKNLMSFLSFLRSCSAKANAVRELWLIADQSAVRGNFTDPSLFMQILQHLPHLHVLHVTDVLFTGPTEMVIQALADTGYRRIVLDQLYYTTTLSMLASVIKFHQPDVINADRIAWLWGLFQHIRELYMHTSAVLTLGGPELDFMRPTVEKVVVRANPPYDACHVLRIELQAVRCMDLGTFSTGDMAIIGELLSRATSLEDLSCDISVIHPLYFGMTSSEARHGLGMIRSRKLRTITLSGVFLVNASIHVATDILSRVLHGLRALQAANAPTVDQLPLSVHIVFCNEIASSSEDFERIAEKARLMNGSLLDTLEKLLLQFTNPQHGVAPIKLRLSHSLYTKEQCRIIAASIFPRLQAMNAEFD
ncbi:hypothetical protein NM688_g6851 [Phlebia brevispora]|uniref:Uncharacterized protein n=1 Tax=Phlebia brevispora TaxID=194682 RepID=A0ACC1SBU2_9APHY|nr:hypothetical protein NM688_g6851 [Phlebia brevispora]